MDMNTNMNMNAQSQCWQLNNHLPCQHHPHLAGLLRYRGRVVGLLLLLLAARLRRRLLL